MFCGYLLFQTHPAGSFLPQVMAQEKMLHLFGLKGQQNGLQRQFLSHLRSPIKQGLVSALGLGTQEVSLCIISVVLILYMHLCILLYGDKCQM